MAEEKTCPAHFGTKLYKYECGAKIIRKEPLIGSQEILGAVTGLKNFEGDQWKLGKLAEMTEYFSYECENGHILTRPLDWADVPIVPPGTIKCRYEWENTQHQWFYELPEDKKEEIWKAKK